jgi:hypothetical protein
VKLPENLTNDQRQAGGPCSPNMSYYCTHFGMKEKTGRGGRRKFFGFLS